jgi:6-pyruvoyltetrahydropterin/6-carboxytetrahydropterin synthase
MPIGYLTRAVQFSASHRYHRPDWSDEENEQRFGRCARPEGHGHNYRCEVTVMAPIDLETGMVIDLGDLDRVLESQVVSRFDHRNINVSVEEFRAGAAIPTTENLAAFILARVSASLPAGVKVHRVRVREDRDLWSDVYGSQQAD